MKREVKRAIKRGRKQYHAITGTSMQSRHEIQVSHWQKYFECTQSMLLVLQEQADLHAQSLRRAAKRFAEDEAEEEEAEEAEGSKQNHKDDDDCITLAEDRPKKQSKLSFFFAPVTTTGNALQHRVETTQDIQKTSELEGMANDTDDDLMRYDRCLYEAFISLRRRDLREAISLFVDFETCCSNILDAYEQCVQSSSDPECAEHVERSENVVATRQMTLKEELDDLLDNEPKASLVQHNDSPDEDRVSLKIQRQELIVELKVLHARTQDAQKKLAEIDKLLQ